MTTAQVDDTLDFSALDAISSSATPRILQKQVKIDPASDDLVEGTTQQHGSSGARRRANSDYSIHLSALGMPSASSTLDLERDLVQVHSDDIGGPSDFTLNMADWINGTRSKATRHVKEVFADSFAEPPKELNGNPDSDASTRAPPPAAVENASGEPVETVLQSSQCLPEPTYAPDLVAQLAALQGRCEQLQRSNDELRGLLKSHDQSRESVFEQKLRTERDMRLAERTAADAAQVASDRDLQRVEERAAALERKLSDERAATAQAQVDTELVQQDLHVQIATWKQHANESKRKLIALETLRESTPELKLPDRVQQLEAQLAALKMAHSAELQRLRNEYDGVAKDVDEFIVAKVKAKDDYFAAIEAKRQIELTKLKSRNKELERLYALCGKELMLTWGREELGPPAAGAKQKYRYQHA